MHVSRTKLLETEVSLEELGTIVNKLETGVEITGKVSNILESGAIVQFGSLSGFLHISEIKYGKVSSIKDVLKLTKLLKLKLLKSKNLKT